MRERKKNANRRCKRTACLVRVGRSLFSLFFRSFFVFLCARKRLSKLTFEKKAPYPPHPPLSTHTPRGFSHKKKRGKKKNSLPALLHFPTSLPSARTRTHAHARAFLCSFTGEGHRDLKEKRKRSGERGYA
jgi:hypothetical protein